jgi:hypothetical protein
MHPSSAPSANGRKKPPNQPLMTKNSRLVFEHP